MVDEDSRSFEARNRQVGEAIEVLRRARGWTREELGVRAGVSAELVKKLENGGTGSMKHGSYYRIADALGVHVAVLFGGTDTVAVNKWRRDITKAGLATAADIYLWISAGGDLTHALELPEHTADGWEEVVWEHECAYPVAPPGEMLPGLTADIVALHQAMRRTTDDTPRRLLARSCSKLSALLAMTAGNLGERTRARDWWRSAIRLADDSENLDLSVWIRGHTAMGQLYSCPSPMVALRRAEQALLMSNRRATASVMEAMAARAQALAMIGQTEAAEDTVETMERRFSTIRPHSGNERMATNAWTESALHHTKAFVYSYLGRFAPASQAQDAARALYPSCMTRQHAQIEFLTAICLVRRGDVASGLQHALHVLESLPLDQRTALIRICARNVLGAVSERDRKRKDVDAQGRSLSALIVAEA